MIIHNWRAHLAALLATTLSYATPAQSQDSLNEDFLFIIENAISEDEVSQAIAWASAAAASEICTQKTWEGVEQQLAKAQVEFSDYGLRPTIDRSENGQFMHFFAWGPDIDEAVEQLNPDLGRLYLNLWITIELKNWGTHRAIHCRYAASGDGNELLFIAKERFMTYLLFDVLETASHDAPMLYQPPDRRQVKLFQSEDQMTTLELRGGSARIDLIFDRVFE